jgi:hypothetical protein
MLLTFIGLLIFRGASHYGRQSKETMGLSGQTLLSRMLLWDWTLGLAFGGFTLRPSKLRLWEFMTKGLDFGLGLWRLHIMPRQRLHLLYSIGYLLSTHLFGLSTKFGHSIPRPLDLDGHNVKHPLVCVFVFSVSNTKYHVLCC